MNFNEYQIEASRTFSCIASTENLHVAALGLCGESGEVADMVKKHVAQGHELDRDKLIKELGDVLWYIALASSCIGVDLDDVAEANKVKLRARYPNGFDAELSRNRANG
jgi:NTP pyrophosphatase (non-canonical NTP hydrolase)